MSSPIDHLLIIVNQKDSSTIKEYLPKTSEESGLLYSTVLLTILFSLNLTEEDISTVMSFEGKIKFVSVPDEEYTRCYITYSH